jgi:hypothetical protein
LNLKHILGTLLDKTKIYRGSAGRIRTYDQLVNSEPLYH